ncbi:zinc finger protein 92-like [Ptychodera flava]|uniref:zinc finger protein 92-like n=1 Tax=Ptychodera flava TaxID=63121 RepID=UPI00396AA09B
MLHQPVDLTMQSHIPTYSVDGPREVDHKQTPPTTELVNLGHIFPIDVKAPLQELHSLDTMQVTRRTYRCSDCGYETNRRNNLKRHISTMHEVCEKKLECCTKEFGSKAELRKHIQSKHRHGYNCTMCGKNFCRKALLKRHLTVHSGQKEFSCELCGYATSHKSNLERHKKVHTKACLTTNLDRCDTSSASPPSMTETDSITSLESSTNLARAPSSDEMYFTDDERANSDDGRGAREIRLWKTPYKCSVCGILLSTQRYLARHRRNKHYQQDKLLELLAMPITRRYLLLHRAESSVSVP